MEIKQSIQQDTPDILMVHTLAFGTDKGPEIAELVHGLLGDETALPRLSLVAIEKNQIIGHILFTRSVLKGAPSSLETRLLAPLAIHPDRQGKGIGRRLIMEGVNQLRESGVDLVFVLGHPDYYPRAGFTPAGVWGFEAPYPIPDEHAGAWMVLDLKGDVLGRFKGRVQCSQVLDQPQHWRE